MPASEPGSLTLNGFRRLQAQGERASGVPGVRRTVQFAVEFNRLGRLGVGQQASAKQLWPGIWREY